MRVSKILMMLLAVILVTIACLLTGLRLISPYVNTYRTHIEHMLNRVSQKKIAIGKIAIEWYGYDPEITVQDVSIDSPQHYFFAKQIIVNINLLSTILHVRPQFNYVEINQANVKLGHIAKQKQSSFSVQQLEKMLLQQVHYARLQGVDIHLTDPLDKRIELNVPDLKWLNQHQTHLVEGHVAIKENHQPTGLLQINMDLHDSRLSLLDHGRIYIKADQLKIQPWLNRLLGNKLVFDQVGFNVSTWIELKSGVFNTIYSLISNASIAWHAGESRHDLAVNQLSIIGSRTPTNHWQFTIPNLNLALDKQPWDPRSQLSLSWMSEKLASVPSQLSIQATNILLHPLIAPVRSLLSSFGHQQIVHWIPYQASGRFNMAIDIPLTHPQQSHFALNWQDLSWHKLASLPDLEHLSGSATGSGQQGTLSFALHNSPLVIKDMFSQPLQLQTLDSQLNWSYSAQNGLRVQAQHVTIQNSDLCFNGRFSFVKPVNGEPYLGILAAMSLKNANQAWRYYPKKYMSRALISYLKQAVQGGEVHDATFIYAGSPHLFPFKHHEGIFRIFVPLRHAEFRFAADWPVLKNFAINLDFLNDSLSMSAPEIKLGKVIGKNITAAIPDYQAKKLVIDANLQGQGEAIRNYFIHTPLRSTIGKALDEIQIKGALQSRLHLTIPLDQHSLVTARGYVELRDNQLIIAPIKAHFSHVTGRFYYHNAHLVSDNIAAEWLNSPIDFKFLGDKENQHNYKVNVDLQGTWQAHSLSGFNNKMSKELAGAVTWNSQVVVNLAEQAAANYRIRLNADLSKFASLLPVPLAKKKDTPLKLYMLAVGDNKQFNLNGHLGDTDTFNSQWRLMQAGELLLDKAIWQAGKKTPELPASSGIQVHVTDVDGARWLGLLTTLWPTQQQLPLKLAFATAINLHVARLEFADQIWRNVTLSSLREGLGNSLSVTGDQIKGRLTVDPNQAWNINLDYLDYVPETLSKRGVSLQGNKQAVKTQFLGGHWPHSLNIICSKCLLFGKEFSHVSAHLEANSDELILTQGEFSQGDTQLKLNGYWKQQNSRNYSHFHGILSGSDVNKSTKYFDINTPLRGAPFKFNFDLSWLGLPWQPQMNTLSGKIDFEFDKGRIEDVTTGKVGKILSFMSLEALLHKLRADFKGAFSNVFYFDRIKGSGNIKQGILSTQDLFVDGASADISMSGKVNLNQQSLDLQAIVAPELSTAVGVAGAFAVNPLFGATAFVVSKLFGSVWDKISFIHYHIEGKLTQPIVHETARSVK